MRIKPFAGVTLAAVLLSSCSTAWAQSCEQKLNQLDRLIDANRGQGEAQLDAVRIMRDMGAQQCQQGNEAAANPILDMQIRRLQADAAARAEEAASTVSKAKLTPDYLQGSWCTWQVSDNPDSRRDSAEYYFYPDGSFHSGHPPSYRLDKSHPAWPHERFLAADHERVIELSADAFRTRLHDQRDYIWQRGGC